MFGTSAACDVGGDAQSHHRGDVDGAAPLAPFLGAPFDQRMKSRVRCGPQRAGPPGSAQGAAAHGDEVGAQRRHVNIEEPGGERGVHVDGGAAAGLRGGRHQGREIRDRADLGLSVRQADKNGGVGDGVAEILRGDPTQVVDADEREGATGAGGRPAGRERRGVFHGTGDDVVTVARARGEGSPDREVPRLDVPGREDDAVRIGSDERGHRGPCLRDHRRGGAAPVVERFGISELGERRDHGVTDVGEEGRTGLMIEVCTGVVLYHGRDCRRIDRRVLWE